MKLLDLFCGVGGASMGYYRAGFTEIVGVDTIAYKRYPFDFVHADAYTYPLDGFDLIHASPPCQPYSQTKHFLRAKGQRVRGEPDGIERIRALLCGRNYVIENVWDAPLLHPFMLCGEMFGLRVIRHRLFECSFRACAPAHRKHRGDTNSHLRYSRGRYYITVGGNNYNVHEGKDAMGIQWAVRREELNEAIPPAYTEYVGTEFLRVRC